MSALRKLAVFIALIALLALTGCANKLETTLAPDLAGTTNPVQKLGLGGTNGEWASFYFQKYGYSFVILDKDPATAMSQAKAMGDVDYISIQGDIDNTSFNATGQLGFKLKVKRVADEQVVWSGDATYSDGGMTKNWHQTCYDGMMDLIKDFSQNFPPAR